MLITIPAIALSMAIMSMRNTTYSVQTSVYVVYLKQIGLFRGGNLRDLLVAVRARGAAYITRPKRETAESYHTG